MAQYIFPPTYSSIKSVPSLPKKRGDSNPSLIPSHLLLDPSIIHTFLIRTPVKACPSYYRLCQPPASAVTGFHYYDPQEAGYRELRLLFDFLRSEGRDPLIVESEELLKHPVEVMKMWCEEVEIEFNESMLSWSEGSKEHL